MGTTKVIESRSISEVISAANAHKYFRCQGQGWSDRLSPMRSAMSAVRHGGPTSTKWESSGRQDHEWGSYGTHALSRPPSMNRCPYARHRGEVAVLRQAP